jgi:hypothetical protein
MEIGSLKWGTGEIVPENRMVFLWWLLVGEARQTRLLLALTATLGRYHSPPPSNPHARGRGTPNQALVVRVNLKRII